MYTHTMKGRRAKRRKNRAYTKARFRLIYDLNILCNKSAERDLPQMIKCEGGKVYAFSLSVVHTIFLLTPKSFFFFSRLLFLLLSSPRFTVLQPIQKHLWPFHSMHVC